MKNAYKRCERLLLAPIIYNGSLVYWGLTPQQQPGPYRGGDDEMSVSLVEET